MNSTVSTHASSEQIKTEIQERMGLYPSFFLLAEHSPEIMGALWQQAQVAYLDNPLPSMFKEKLFTYLSRFCSSPYCMGRHSAFLSGRGHVAGDADCHAIDAGDVAELLARPLPSPQELKKHVDWLSEDNLPITDVPAGSLLEQALVSCSAVLFLSEYKRDLARYPESQIKLCKSILNQRLGNELFQNLVVFLSFIRTAHFWMSMHSELHLEDDAVQLLNDNPDLARWVDSYTGIVDSEAIETRHSLLADAQQSNEKLLEEIAKQAGRVDSIESGYRHIAKDLNGILWKCSTNPIRFQYVSENAERILGYPVQRWIDEPDFWSNMIVDEDREKAVSFCREQTTAGHDHQFQYRMRRADGEVIWIGDFVRLVRDNAGELTHLQGMMVDITAQKNAERNARESQSTMRLMFESGPECVKIIDSNCRLIDMNSAGLAMIGADSLDPLVGRSVLPMLLPEHRARFTEACARVFQGEHVFLEFEMQGLQGNRLWVESHASPIRNDDGEIISQLAITRNITEKKATREKMRSQVNRTRELLDTTLDGYVRADVNGKVLYVNRAYCEMLGYDQAELLSMNINDIEAPLDSDDVGKRINRMMTDGRDRFETRHRRRDGSLVDLDVSIVVLDRNTESPNVSAFVRDITGQKAAQAALRESESRFRAIFEQAAIGVAQIESRTGRFVRVNQRYADITGYSIDELIATDFQLITHPDDLQNDLTLLDQLCSGEILEYSMEKRYFKKDGSIVWVALTVSPFWNVGEEPDFHIAIVEDISVRIAALDSLKANKARLREMNLDLESRVNERTAELIEKNQELEDFAHNISHDLRAPLRAMEGFSTALSEDFSEQLGTTGNEFVQHIRDAARHMDHMVNDLLSYSRLGRAELNPIDVELALVVRQAMDQFNSEISDRQAQFEIDEKLRSVVGHRSTLVQIVANLIENALKFVPSEVRPKVRIWSETREDHRTAVNMIMFHDRHRFVV